MASPNHNPAQFPNQAPGEQYEPSSWQGVPQGMPITAETDFSGTGVELVARHDVIKELGADLPVCAVVHDHASGLQFWVVKRPDTVTFDMVDANKYDAAHPKVMRKDVFFPAPYLLVQPVTFKAKQGQSGFLGVRRGNITHVNWDNPKLSKRFGIAATPDALAKVDFDVSVNVDEAGRERLVIVNNSSSQVDISYVTQKYGITHDAAAGQANAEGPVQWPMPEVPRGTLRDLGRAALRRILGR